MRDLKGDTKEKHVAGYLTNPKKINPVLSELRSRPSTVGSPCYPSCSTLLLPPRFEAAMWVLFQIRGRF